MVSIIKNQLLKHLSRFTKNLSVDQINLSTLRGEGELSNLELDEAVLTDLLELPSWLKLTNAWCNKVILRIQWTKLKSVPIFLHLDEVQIELVTCEDLRSPSSPTNAASALPGATKYSFIHKVIDGITIAVNTVSVKLKSPAFIASVQISRIMVESKSPTWQRCDLRMTRVKDPDRGQLLIFKELEWQTVRIEAQSTIDQNLTPLRLLTNQARCRITIKKRLSDCFVMGSRLVIILDDLLWVLTDSQLKAALHFIDSLGSLIEKATTIERKIKAARKLEVLPEYQAQISQQSRSKVPCNTAISKIFMRYDVVETSYHFLSQRIDLHLCDDPGTGRSSYPELKDGGALQISLIKFQIDYYPYHLAMSDRKHWAKYRENTMPHYQWLQQSFNSFRGQFMDLIDVGQKMSRKNSGPDNDVKNDDKFKNDQQTPLLGHEKKLQKQTSTVGTGNSIKNYVLEQLSTLMTTCIVIRIYDLTIYKVTTTTRKPITKEFLTGDREKFSLPEDVTILHAEFTYYYYPGDLIFPLPPPKFYVQVNPIQINYDIYSCLWFNSFLLNLYKSLASSENKTNAVNDMYFDVKLEAILPRIIVESQNDYPNQRDRPKSLNIQTSRVTLTNVRSTDSKSSRADLAECLNALQMGQMFFSSSFPSNNNDYNIVTDKFLRHCAGSDNVRSYPSNFTINSIDDIIGKLNKKLLWLECKDIWCLNLEPVWADFYGVRAVGMNRPVPLLDAFPLTVWLHIEDNNNSTAPTTTTNKNNDSKVGEKMIKNADVHILAHISNLISVQLNHYQYLFLLRQLEIVTEMSTYLVVDTNRITNVTTGSSLVIGALIPQLEVTLIMPSQTPGKENSGGDLESVVPDSSSIAEELLPISLTNQSVATRLEFGLKRFNTSNDVETPQSEVSSMIGSIDTGHPTVTFKAADKNYNKDTSNYHQRQNSEDLEARKYLKYSKDPAQSAFIQNNFNVGLSSMKKGFANLMTSIDSALKASPEDGSSDTVSMRSDISSDSENYIVVTLEEQEKSDSLFGNLNVTNITAVEEASEVIEETPDTQSEKSLDSACKRKDLVSMVTFKLSKVEVIQQSKGFSSAIKLQVAKIMSEECTSIPWDELQTKFSSRSRGWSELQSDDCKISVKIRLEHDLKKQYSNLNDNLNSKNNKISTLFDDKITGEINDINLVLSMSTVNGLMDLLEDEILPDYLPINLLLNNICIKLIEDRPSNNITSPGPIPIDLVVQQLKVARDKNGIINIESFKNNIDTNAPAQVNSSTDSELLKLKQLNKQIKNDNDELKRRLVALDYLSEENLRLKRNKDELHLVKLQLNEAQELIKELIKEKNILKENNLLLQTQSKRSNDSSSSGRASWSIKR
ncbi:bridge-like lipid transfer protein family member 3A [Microplitis demolitor]|uniref:bridge-like lipid transfer protein family member 3A n=1 Tax=Microplitis demolitor TaxID=69319 RepID=UPI0004CDD6CF|nr:bridge-like lipid transfer protein family member 3A [Microplitis demolitor]